MNLFSIFILAYLFSIGVLIPAAEIYADDSRAQPMAQSQCVKCHIHVKGLNRLSWEVEKRRPVLPGMPIKPTRTTLVAMSRLCKPMKCGTHIKRWAGGWKLEGLPWSYGMDAKYMYPSDVEKKQADAAKTSKALLISKQ